MRLPEPVARAIAALETAGFETWAVGGCVRDSLRGVTPHDWDVCTAARPEQMKAVFAGARLLETGLKHGTLTLLAEDMPIEITTFRTEDGYSDGRHPDAVRFVANVREDLARRDFTIGAMAWHPARGLCDPFGGESDLSGGLLRAVGDPDARFREDALRILRAVRFASRMGFRVEEQTAAAMRRQAARLQCIAAERVRAELTGLLCGRYVQRALMEFNDILCVVLPEIAPMFGCIQQNPHHRYDVWEHTVRAVGQVPAEPALRWAMLLHDSGKPASKTIDEKGIGHFYGHPKASRALAEAIVRRLRFSGADAERIVLLVEQHDLPLGDDERTARRRLSKLGEAYFRDLLAIKKGDAVGRGTQMNDIGWLYNMERRLNDALAQQACVSLHDLAVNGGDMIKLGLSGPAIGKMLNALLDAVIDETVENEHDALLAFAMVQQQAQNGGTT